MPRHHLLQCLLAPARPLRQPRSVLPLLVGLALCPSRLALSLPPPDATSPLPPAQTTPAAPAPITATSPALPVDPPLDVARARVGEGNYAAALAAYQEHLRIHPEDRTAQLELARVLSWEQRYPAALALYDALLATPPGRGPDLELALERARVLTWAARYDEAIPALLMIQRLLASPPVPAPVEPPPPSRAGRKRKNASTSGRSTPSAATSSVTPSPAPALASPTPASPTVSGATVATSTTASPTTGSPTTGSPANPATAPQATAESASSQPSPAPEPLADRVARTLADAYAWGGHPDLAEPLLLGLSARYPADRTLTLSLARALSAQKRFDDALIRYQALMDQDPSDPNLCLERAKVLLWAERYPAALDALRSLQTRLRQEVPTPPRDALLAELSRTLAAGLSWSGDLRGAVEEYARLVLLFPQDAALRLAYARALVAFKDLNTAVLHYRAYFELEPHDLRVGLEQARVLLWAGRHQETVVASAILLERLQAGLQPDLSGPERTAMSKEATRLLAQSLLWSGRPGDALPWLRLLLSENPGDVRLGLELADALAADGQLIEARDAYQRFEALGGDHLTATLGEGRTWQWEGDPLRARRCFKTVLDAVPYHPEALKAMQGLRPQLRKTLATSLEVRADVTGFSQERLAFREEHPAGLLWLSSELGVERVGTDSGWLRLTPSLKARHQASHRLQLEGQLGLQASPTLPTPLSPQLRLATTFSPVPTLHLTGRLVQEEALELLFSPGSLSGRVQDSALETSLAWEVGPWQVWSRARGDLLWSWTERPNPLLQLQASAVRELRLNPGGPTELRVGLAAGTLHFQRSDERYWSPGLYTSLGLTASLETSPVRWLRLSAGLRGGGGWERGLGQPFPELSGELTVSNRPKPSRPTREALPRALEGSTVDRDTTPPAPAPSPAPPRNLLWRLSMAGGSTARVQLTEAPTPDAAESYWQLRATLEVSYVF